MVHALARVAFFDFAQIKTRTNMFTITIDHCSARVLRLTVVSTAASKGYLTREKSQSLTLRR